MSGGTPPIAGVILAGGQASRMGGGDKGLRLLGGRTLLARVVERIRPQVGPLLLNAGGDPARFAALELPVADDAVPGRLGPLAGVLTGLEWAGAQEAEWLLSVPCDVPFLPVDLLTRLDEARAEAGAEVEVAWARSGGREHPVCALWSVALAPRLRLALEGEGVRSVGGFLARCRGAVADFGDGPDDPFLNLNRPEDLGRAERLLGTPRFPAG